MTSRTLLCTAVALALALSPATGVAQRHRGDHRREFGRDFGREPGHIAADGTEVFRLLLHFNGLTPISEQDLGEVPLEEVILVVLGDPNGSFIGDQSTMWWAAQTVQKGGAVLIASDSFLDFSSDFPSAVNKRRWNTRITGGQVLGTELNTLYLGQPNCPFVLPLTPRPGEGGPEWSIFEGLNHIATNAPSYLHVPVRRDEFRSSLAAFPRGCWFSMIGGRAPGGGWRDLDPNEFPFAVGSSGPYPGTENRYRFLAMADPSVFINEMMVQQHPNAPSPDNLKFAMRVASFLSEEDLPAGGKRKRTRCLLVQNGQVVRRLNDLESMLRPPLPPIPMPNLEKLQEKIVEFGDKIVDKLQEKNALNTMLLGRDEERQNRTLRGILIGLVVLTSICAALFMLYKVWKTKQPTDVPPPPPGGQAVSVKGDEAGTGKGAFERRQRELLRRNNLYEPVSAVVREMFTAAGAPTDAGPKLPPVVIASVVRRSDTLRKALADLWKIGYGQPTVVTAQQWNVLGPLFERARKAHADRKWWFESMESESVATARKGSEV